MWIIITTTIISTVGNMTPLGAGGVGIKAHVSQSQGSRSYDYHATRNISHFLTTCGCRTYISACEKNANIDFNYNENQLCLSFSVNVPGKISFPVASITRVPPGTSRFNPTLFICLKIKDEVFIV